MRLRDVLADRVAFVPMHAALALLKIDGIRRQVPVHGGVAVQVEVQTLLAHRC
jgi:hypothetical protein